VENTVEHCSYTFVLSHHQGKLISAPLQRLTTERKIKLLILSVASSSVESMSTSQINVCDLFKFYKQVSLSHGLPRLTVDTLNLEGKRMDTRG